MNEDPATTYSAPATASIAFGFLSFVLGKNAISRFHVLYFIPHNHKLYFIPQVKIHGNNKQKQQRDKWAKELICKQA